MAGHNKWSSIKHKKAKTDAQKGKAFSKVSREIVMAVKCGGDKEDMNPRLRLALQKARDVNMPNDNIKRAIQKGSGNDDDTNLEENTYEAYGPNGVAILIQTLTDNKNRTIANIKTIINKGGGNMATPGAVSYMFESKGLILLPSSQDEDALMTIVLDTGADHIDRLEDGTIEILMPPSSFESTRHALEKDGVSYDTAVVTMIPTIEATVDQATYDAIQSLIDKLEDDEDVQEVFTNMIIA